MLHRRIFAALATLCFVLLPSQAWSQAKTKAAITTEINTTMPSGCAGCINATVMRSALLDIVNSYLDNNGGTPTLTAALDGAFSCTNGQLLQRGASVWGCGVAYPFSGTSGGIPYFSSTSAVSASGALGSNNIVVGGGAGGAPAANALFSIASNVMTAGINGNTSGVIDFANGGGGGAAVRFQNLSTTVGWSFNLPATAGSSGQPLLSGGGGGVAQTYGTLGVPGGGTGVTALGNHGVLVGQNTGAIGSVAAMTDGQILVGQTGADPSQRTVSGDATLAASGALTLNANKVWIGRQVFTASGTYTPTSGTNGIDARCVGGGGAGGSVAATGAGQAAIASGGAAGGRAEGRFTTSFSGVTVTIGAAGAAGPVGQNNGGTGGNTTFGALLTANGGTGGNGGGAAAPVTSIAGVAGGTASGGDFQVNGQPSAGVIYVSSVAVQSSAGGSGVYGAGGAGITTLTTSTGNAGSGHGSGGGGGANAASQSAVAGGAGTGGMCVVDEFK